MSDLTQCPGSGKRWGRGIGRPICPVCHLGWRALGLDREPLPIKSVRVPKHPHPEEHR